jgi:hypothetical protein
MQYPDDSRTGETTIATKRPAGKGSPPPKGNTLGALSAVPSRQDKTKTKAKNKSPKISSKERTGRLNFRVSADLRRAFKRAAAAQDCKKVELLERIFTEWNARNPV